VPFAASSLDILYGALRLCAPFARARGDFLAGRNVASLLVEALSLFPLRLRVSQQLLQSLAQRHCSKSPLQPLRVAARLLHKGLTSRRRTDSCIAYYLQIRVFSQRVA
jgi:hypothetical protein